MPLFAQSQSRGTEAKSPETIPGSGRIGLPATRHEIYRFVTETEVKDNFAAVPVLGRVEIFQLLDILDWTASLTLSCKDQLREEFFATVPFFLYGYVMPDPATASQLLM